MANVTETVSSLRSLASALEKAGNGSLVEFPASMLDGEAAVGAAAFLCYMRDCITSSPREVWPKGDLLVLLETCSRDGELFPNGIAELMWNLEDE